jgi:predicted CxxxxCH...CXXCH cytochrome family protein
MLVVVGTAFAANPYLHYFDCKNCHFPNATMAQMSADHICLKCHAGASVTAPNDKLVPPLATAMDPNQANDSRPGMINWKARSVFSTGDASNKFGHNPAPGKQTSHNWAASNTQPVAGASEPNRTTYAGFYSRYGASTGKVTCTRCHNPHGEAVIDANLDGIAENPLANPKLFIADSQNANKPIDPEKMCRACHSTYASQDAGNHGLVGHPVTSATYSTVITGQESKYKTEAEVNAAPGNSKPTLVGGKVTCLSCHNLHYVDSDSTTADGLGATLNNGDGNLLKGDGAQFVNDPVRSTTFCNTCHEYATGFHGTGASAIGCMGCHGGHNNTSATPSYYMLNGGYTTLPTTSAEKSALWAGTQAGVQDGFCESCHGNIEDAPFNAVRVHIPGEDCTTCHLSHGDGAFSQPIGCDGCHGSPPQFNSPGNTAAAGYVLNGYAWAPTGSNTGSQYSYSTSGHLKDESTTPHTSHSGATARYSFQCKVCHNTHIDKFATTHNKDNTSFRDVLEATSPFDPKAQAGAIVPAYNDGHPTGTCNNVYCHSNGGLNNGAGVRTFSFTAAPWAAGGKGSIVGTANECGSCHGNDSTDMLPAGKNNSAAHIKHLSAGFSCNTCHTSTAASATAYQGGTPPTSHMNKTVDVAFTTAALKAGGAAVSFPAGSFNGANDTTCDTVYCHSNGNLLGGQTVYRSINWATGPVNLTCTSCHNVPGAAGDKQTAAHAAHVNGSASNVGRNLDCGVCHDNTMDVGNNGALGTGGLVFHVNGKVEVKMNLFGIDTGTCSNISCHSDGNFEVGATLTPKNIAWTSGTSLGCDSCHGDGAGKSYPVYANAGVGVNSNSHQKHVGGGIVCTECHSQTTATNTAIDGSNPTKHVNRSVEVSGTKITSYTDGSETCSAAACHGAGSPQWGGTVACGSCHAANNTLAQSHGKHYDSATAGDITVEANNSTATNYRIQCGVCHSANGAGAISHAGGWVDTTAPNRRTAQVNFDGTVASGTYTAGAVETADSGFYYTNATCAALYCHGNFGGNGNNATATWGNAASGACGTCHDVDTSATMGGGSHSKHVKVAGITCDYCHGATAVNAAGGVANKALHVNRALNWDFAAAAKPQTAGAIYNLAASGTIAAANVGIAGNYAQCGNLYCHSTVQAVPPNGTVGVTYANPTWGGSAACGTCHKGDAAGVEQDTASHLIHTDADQYGSRFACSACHEAAGSGTALHANYAVDVNINASYDRGGAGAGTYSGTPAPGNAYGSCTNLTCHSNGQNANPLVVPTWNVALSCAGCHDEAKAGSTLSSSHGAHIFGATATLGRNLGCQECHADTVSSNIALNATTGYAKHVNFVKDLKVPNFGTPQASCATVFCHSNGNYGATLIYKAPTWGASYTCDSCHGDDPTNKAYPVYANGGVGNANANSHTEHIVGGGYTCNDCHSKTSTAGASINGTDPTQHVDNSVDVAGAKIASFAGGTCSTVTCHGGNSPQWGANLGCRDCHGNPTTDTDDFTYNNGTFAKVALDDWTFSGHGKPAAANYEVTGRAGADLDTKGGAGQDACLYCHDGNVSHGNANLFRLRNNSSLGYTDLNGACLGCHDTGTTSYDPDGAGGLNAVNVTTVVKIDKYHGGASHDALTRDAGRWCWDCHDPHGDADAAGQRIQMVQRNPQVNPDANGVPASLATTNDIIFTNNTIGAGAGGFAMNAAPFSQGICNTCHTAANTTQYTQTTGAGTHPTSKCTVCHKHSGDATYDGLAFKGSGCNGCHGNNVAGNYWPDDYAGAAMPTANNAGRHAKHMEVLASRVYGQTLAQLLADAATDTKQRNLCTYCHTTPGTDGDHGVLANLPADVNSMKNLWAPYAADNASYSSDQHGQVGNDTCSNVNCHNNKLTTDNTYGWYNAGTSACIMCHSDAPAEQTHAAHLSATIYGLTADNCAYCHDSTTNWATNTKPANNHLSGTFEVSGSVTLAYDGTYPTVKGSCGTNACHNSGRNGAPASGVYTWGTTTNSSCSFCHAPGLSHTPHIAASGTFFSGGAACNWCHTHNGPSTDHLNATINVNATMGYTGSNLGVTQAPAYGACSTTTCHQNGKGVAVATPAWNASWAGQSCDICHFNGSAAKTAAGAHGTHIGTAGQNSYTATANASTAANYIFNCGKCHGGTLANHLNSWGTWATPNVEVAATVAYNAGTDSCVNNACHNNGKGTGVGNDALRTAYWAANNWGAGDDSDKCNNCHGNSPSTNAHRAHAVGIHAEDIYSGATGKLSTLTATKSHGDATNSSTISCNVCHSGTVASARNKFGTECVSCHNGDAAGTAMAVADKSKHVDDGTATAEVSFVDMTAFKSKAQLRDNLADANDGTTILSAVWNRVTGYKAAASHDKGQVAFATPNFAGGNCSNVACHNNELAIWNSVGNINPATYAPNCMGCHTSLPK